MQQPPPAGIDHARRGARGGGGGGARRGCVLRPAPLLHAVANMIVAQLLLTMLGLALVQGQYNPNWGPSPCGDQPCLPHWTPTYNV
jgi:hypothetical protein